MSNPIIKNGSKVLVAVYSYSGVSRQVAETLREITCGIIFPIETVNTYNKRSVIEDAKRELQEGRLPALKQAPPDMAGYDYIFVGGPVWWFTVATPVMAFLKQADFKGKPTAAFCTHEGGVGRYFSDYEQQVRNGQVLQGIELFSHQRSKQNVSNELNAWLSGVVY